MIQANGQHRLIRDMEALIRRHGRWATLRAVLWALLARKRRRTSRTGLRDADALPEHLRRDIGLPPRMEETGHRPHMR